jgi:hypothetical protein
LRWRNGGDGRKSSGPHAPEAGLFTSSERVPPVTLVREEVVLGFAGYPALFVAGV